MEAFLVSVHKGDTVNVRNLIQNGADVNLKDRLGWTPLHYASFVGNTKMAELLLDAGASVNSQNNDGYTPLHWAVQNNHKRMIVLLTERGANQLLRDNLGDAPVDLSPVHLRGLMTQGERYGNLASPMTNAALHQTASSPSLSTDVLRVGSPPFDMPRSSDNILIRRKIQAVSNAGGGSSSGSSAPSSPSWAPLLSRARDASPARTPVPAPAALSTSFVDTSLLPAASAQSTSASRTRRGSIIGPGPALLASPPRLVPQEPPRGSDVAVAAEIEDPSPKNWNERIVRWSKQLYNVGRKPAVTKLIQILFQVVLCLLLELLQEQMKRFFQLVVLLGPAQLYFLLQPLTYLHYAVRPVWTTVLEPLLRPFIWLVANPLRSFIWTILLAVGSVLGSVFNTLFAPILEAIWSPIVYLVRDTLWLPVWTFITQLSWASRAWELLLINIRAALVPKQLLATIFIPLVSGLKWVLLKYIHLFPLPVLTVVSRLAYLAFGFASEEEAAVMIVLSFTVCFYGSVLGLAYSYKLSWLGMRGVLRLTTNNERAEALSEPWRAPGGWKPDLEHHQFGASLLCILVAMILFSNMLLIGLRRAWRRRTSAPSPPPTHPAVVITSSEPS